MPVFTSQRIGGAKMNFEVKVHEDHLSSRKPYSVTVNGEWLTKRSGGRRRFESSIAAAVAGSKRADELRAPTVTRDA
jgi:hypothetical protein